GTPGSTRRTRRPGRPSRRGWRRPTTWSRSPSSPAPDPLRASRRTLMGSTTDWVSGRARAVPVSLIRRMFDMTPRVPGAISLAVGEPGFATPPHIVDAACQALHDGFTKYSPNPGYMDLREAIAEKIEHVNGYQADPESEIFVTVGAMQALALTFMCGI